MKTVNKLNQDSKFSVLILILLAVICIAPLLMVVSASFTDEAYIQEYGYTVLPKDPSLDTYEYLLESKGKMLLRAFCQSLLVTLFGTILSTVITTCFAYAITQPKHRFPLARGLSFFGWFTTIFNGGVLPWYILCTQYYGLKDNIWALFLPYALNMFNAFILRGNFRGIPKEILEAAMLDGASEPQIFTRIALPMIKSGLATVSLFNVLMYWNDFHLPQWLTYSTEQMTMQKLLYTMLNNVQALLQHSEAYASVLQNATLPTETSKMAICVLTILPIAVIYPFALKYFVKGINAGGVKG